MHEIVKLSLGIATQVTSWLFCQ